MYNTRRFTSSSNNRSSRGLTCSVGTARRSRLKVGYSLTNRVRLRVRWLKSSTAPRPPSLDVLSRRFTTASSTSSPSPTAPSSRCGAATSSTGSADLVISCIPVHCMGYAMNSRTIHRGGHTG